MVRIDKAIQVPCKLSSNFFYVWLAFFSPIHKITPGVMRVAAELLKYNYILSKSILDSKILNTYLFTNEEIRSKIVETCGISLSNYHVSINKLKQNNFIVNDSINPKYIPPIKEDDNKINVLFMFDIQDLKKDEEDIQKSGTESKSI